MVRTEAGPPGPALRFRGFCSAAFADEVVHNRVGLWWAGFLHQRRSPLVPVGWGSFAVESDVGSWVWLPASGFG